MSLSCLRSLNPNISDVAHLYDDGTENGFMYLGNGTPPPCSSAHPPQPSNCTVCFNKQFIYAVCSDLKKNVKLVMEGDWEPIDLTKSECPGLLATNENADLSSDDMGSQKWWWLLLPLLIVIVILVVACKKYAKMIQEWMQKSRIGRFLSPRSSTEPEVILQRHLDGSPNAHILLGGVRIEEVGGMIEERGGMIEERGGIEEEP